MNNDETEIPQWIKDEQQFIIDFHSNIKKSLIENSPEKFIETCAIYEKKYPTMHPYATMNSMQTDVAKRICCIILSFTNDSEFNSTEINNYIKIANHRINSQYFAFILWSQEKRVECCEVFKKYNLSMHEGIYDNLVSVLSTVGIFPDAPKDKNDKTRYYEKQKEEFFYYQKNSALINELLQLPVNEVKPAKIKL